MNTPKIRKKIKARNNFTGYNDHAGTPHAVISLNISPRILLDEDANVEDDDDNESGTVRSSQINLPNEPRYNVVASGRIISST